MNTLLKVLASLAVSLLLVSCSTTSVDVSTLNPAAVDVSQRIQRLAVVDLGRYEFSLPRDYSGRDWDRVRTWDRWRDRSQLRFSAREMVNGVESELLPTLIRNLEGVGRFSCAQSDYMASLDFAPDDGGISVEGLRRIGDRAAADGVLAIEWIGLNVDQNVHRYVVERTEEVPSDGKQDPGGKDSGKPGDSQLTDKERIKEGGSLKSSKEQGESEAPSKKTVTVSETYFDVSTRVYIEVLFRLYDARSGAVLDEVMLGEVDTDQETLSYEPDHFYTESRISSAIHINLYRIAAEYAQRISPHYEEEQRFVYTRIKGDGNELMQAASRAVKEERWDDAERIWKQLLRGHHGESAARILHNLAVSAEWQKNYDQAVTYARQSLAVFSMDKTMRFLTRLLEARESETEASRQLGLEFE